MRVIKHIPSSGGRRRNFLKSILFRLNPTLYHELFLWHYKRRVLPQEFVNHMSRLGVNDLAIDLGANVGLVTECLARTGARVIAIEPNKTALIELNSVASHFNNVEVIEAAAGIKNTLAKLYLHKNSGACNYKDLTQSSSLLVSKPNVSSEFYEEISEIDFSEYLLSINQPIELIKIDIEGYEIEVVNHLLDTGALENVRHVYLETHERKFKALTAATLKLKERVKEEGLEGKFYFDWH